MDTIVKQGRILFAIAIVAFGVEKCLRPQPRIDAARHPLGSWCDACLPDGHGSDRLQCSGCHQVQGPSCGNIAWRFVSSLLSVSLGISRVAAKPLDVGVRTCAFETLTMCASAMILAGTLSIEGSPRWLGRRVLEDRPLCAVSVCRFHAGLRNRSIPGLQEASSMLRSTASTGTARDQRRTRPPSSGKVSRASAGFCDIRTCCATSRDFPTSSRTWGSRRETL